MWLNPSIRRSSYDFGAVSTVPAQAKTVQTVQKQGILQRDGLFASLKSKERRFYLEERHKSVIAKRDLMERPDIVPKSQGSNSAKSERLIETWGDERQRGKEREEDDYEQRYREEKLTRQHAERQLQELHQKLLFYEDLSRQFSLLKSQLSSTQTDLDSSREKLKETQEIGVSHTKGLISNVKDLETINSTLRTQLTQKSEEIEELKIVKKTILDQAGTEQDRIKREYDHRLKSLETEVKDLTQALEGERKSKRSIELLYADLYEKHRLCEDENAPKLRTAVQTLQGKFQELEAKCMEQLKSTQENHQKSHIQDQDKENSILEPKFLVGIRGKEVLGSASESLDINTWIQTGKPIGRSVSTLTKRNYEGKRKPPPCRHCKGRSSDA